MRLVLALKTIPNTFTVYGQPHKNAVGQRRIRHTKPLFAWRKSEKSTASFSGGIINVTSQQYIRCRRRIVKSWMRADAGVAHGTCQLQSRTAITARPRCTQGAVPPTSSDSTISHWSSPSWRPLARSFKSLYDSCRRSTYSRLS